MALIGLFLVLGIAMTWCSGAFDSSSSGENNRASFSRPGSQSSKGDDKIPTSNATELPAQFGDSGDPFVMRLEDNSTVAAIAGYVGTTAWRLPVYSYDESDAIEYYDIPSRYEIPVNSETVTEAHAGNVFYFDSNRIVFYYHEAEISEEYTLIGRFDATEEFADAVGNNPVLED